MNITKQCYRDFVVIVNQLKLWTLTSDFVYLKDSSRKSFSTLVQRYKVQFQVSEIEWFSLSFDNLRF